MERRESPANPAPATLLFWLASNTEDTMRIFHIDPNGKLIAEGVADESPMEAGVYHIPAGATDIGPPTAPAGMEAVFNAGAWSLQAIPQPVIEPAAPQPTAAQLRRAEILAELALIDTKSVRPLREGDAARVATLNAQAAALRVELAAL